MAPIAPPLGLYRHFKGGLYEVIGCAVHTETGEILVLYRIVVGVMFARPLTSWNQLVGGPDGLRMPRFVPEAETPTVGHADRKKAAMTTKTAKKQSKKSASKVAKKPAKKAAKKTAK